MTRFLLFVCLALVFASSARAGYFVVEGDVFQDSNSLNTSASTTRNVYEGYLNVPLAEKTILFMGVGYLVINASDPATNTATKTLDASMFEINFGLFLDKSRSLKINAVYCPSAAATYSRTDISGSESWTGTAVGGKLSFAPELSTHFAMILSVNYLSMSFDAKSKTSSTVSSVNSFTRTIMYPEIGLQYFF